MMALPSLLLLGAALLPGGQPPSELAHGRTLDRIEITDAGRLIQGIPGYDLAERRVWVTYAATSTGVHPRAEDACTLEGQTAYWPTAVAVLDDQHLAVGGRFSEGGGHLTVVEVWHLCRPHMEVDARGNARLAGAGWVERTRVYESAAEGRDMVRALVRLRGRPGTLLVQFHDSGDVAELEYGPVSSAGPYPSDPARLVLAAQPRPGALYVPALANRALVEISVQEGGTGGFTYTLRPSAALRIARASTAPDDRPLLLIDGDGDGVIDAWRTPGGRESPFTQRRPGT